jgi:hypothetical protein
MKAKINFNLFLNFYSTVSNFFKISIITKIFVKTFKSNNDNFVSKYEMLIFSNKNVCKRRYRDY